MILNFFLESGEKKIEAFFTEKQIEFFTSFGNQFDEERENLFLESYKNKLYENFATEFKNCFDNENIKNVFDKKTKDIVKTLNEKFNEQNEIYSAEFEKIKKPLNDFHKTVDDFLLNKRVELAKDVDVFIKKTNTLQEFCKSTDKIIENVNRTVKEIEKHNMWTMWSSVIVIFLFILAVVLVR